MRNISGRSVALGGVVALGLCASNVAGIAQQSTPTDLVDALNGLFGKHPGDRAALAIAISYTNNHSVLWAIIHGFFSWFYVIYYVLFK